jgi:predicted SnoaL-like aldol condensation-catalyzing enzyme
LIEKNKAIVHQMYDAFNRRIVNDLNELLASDFVDHTPGPEQAPGREGIMSVWSYLFATHPDIRATVGDMLAAWSSNVCRLEMAEH